MAMTPNPNRRLGFSVPPTPSPFYTPRPERRTLDLRWADGSSARDRHNTTDRETNVQVVLRCRPLNDEEQRLNVQQVISCNEQKREVTVLQSSMSKQVDRAFSFDKVFGPRAQQRSIYDRAISPIVNEALEGYTCTVFAFGQTGTGKTYTMEGEMKSKVNELPVDAGVIPRAVRHIFEILEARKADYSVKVTFLELYNEEITDLLADEEQNNNKFYEERLSLRRSISLLEDGKGGEVIRGLKEVVVYSPNDIYNLLERGSARRRTADTLLNKQSSRSHAIFSVNIHLKESTIGNEDVVKCGRLNLVDLAGSENIARSGAREGRAREAGEINKSLLTLGRVITALADRSSHVPYRNSKLTRLLRESLGGKAKTCIIATISPSINCLEETLMTLDYASRAKCIRNKPEANQKLSKSALLKDLYLENEKIKQDLRAAREKNGVYITNERFIQEEADKKTMKEKIQHLEILLDRERKETEKFKQLYYTEQEDKLEMESQIRECKINLESTQRDFKELQEINSRNTESLKEKDFVISSLLGSERVILDRAKDLCGMLQNASVDMSELCSKIVRQSNKEEENKDVISKFRSELDHQLREFHSMVIDTICKQNKYLQSTNEQIGLYFDNNCEGRRKLETRINKTRDLYDSGIKQMKELINALKNKSISDLEQTGLTLCANALAVETFMVTAVSEAQQVLSEIQSSLDEQKKLLAFSAKQHEDVLRRSLVSTQAISKSMLDLFHYIKIHAPSLIKIIEQNQAERSHRIESFQKEFKELSAREEKAALDKIATILSNITATKTNMVLETLGSLDKNCNRDEMKLQMEMSEMEKISSKTETEWIEYIGTVERESEEDRDESEKIRAKADRTIHYCMERVNQSISHWSSTQFSIDTINKGYFSELETSIQKNNVENESMLEEVLSVSSQNDLNFNELTRDMLSVSEDLQMLDQEMRKEIGSISSFSLDNLNSFQENHTQNTEFIQSLANKCLVEDFLVGSPITKIIQDKSVNIPSLESIDGLRASLTELVSQYRGENRSEGKDKGKKQVTDLQTRSPLVPINQFGY